MQYSMAYYRSPNDSLEIAQRNKVDHIAAKLLLEPGMSVLDIGCGWGGLALALHKRHGVSVTGISLSEEQLKIARERADKESAGDDVRFLFQDYREVEGTFDRIVSVGMFEHVGLPLYRTFFKSVRDHLTDDGIALLQTIGADGRTGRHGFLDAEVHFPRRIRPGPYRRSCPMWKRRASTSPM